MQNSRNYFLPYGMSWSKIKTTQKEKNGIEKLMAEDWPVNLAVSLHPPDDELRDTLVPINFRWKIKEVLGAAEAYAEKTGRRYSIEYALIRDINDQT